MKIVSCEDSMTNSELPQMKYPEQKRLISIIIPIYNSEIYLRECLDSILAQTFVNWEAILVDDGSTDNTEKIMDKYAKNDSQFIAIHKQNEGTLLARKTGLENSKGEFIVSIDPDDTCDPQFLEKMYAKITEKNYDFVWCKYCSNRKISWRITDYEWNIEASENVIAMLDIAQRMSFITWNKLIKREIYVKVYFPNVHLILGEDPVQMLQVAYYSKSAAFVPEALYFYRNGGVSSTHKAFLLVRSMVVVNETLEKLFNGTTPYNVRDIFYRTFSYTSYSYFCLNKEEREKIKDKFLPFLPELIKRRKKLNLKICLILASKGIEFPFKLRECVKKNFRYFQQRSSL